MADTKQATPELEVIVEEIWRHYNRGDTTDAVLTLKAALASRSGPDRTAQGRARELAEQFLAVVDSDDYPLDEEAWLGKLTKILEAGLDRGQQDAPELAKECQDLRAWKESAMRQLNKASRLMAILPTPDYWGWDVYDAAIDYIEKLAAKAARAGQAPKGDRIKVEREPGCKCEYAIWTNAKGCPVHDVSDPVHHSVPTQLPAQEK